MSMKKIVKKVPKVKFGGMKIFPDASLAAIVGVRFMKTGLIPTQLTRQVWKYIKENHLLKIKGKRVK